MAQNLDAESMSMPSQLSALSSSLDKQAGAERQAPGPRPLTKAESELGATQLRRVYGRFATGVALVAAQVNDRPVGMLTNSFSSISLDPPLVALSFARTSTTWPQLRLAPEWGISILAQQHSEDMSQLSRPSAKRFDGLDWTVADGGAIFLSRAIARINVHPHEELDGGDHVLALLRVTGAQTLVDEEPLIFYASKRRRLDN